MKYIIILLMVYQLAVFTQYSLLFVPMGSQQVTDEEFAKQSLLYSDIKVVFPPLSLQ